ncbi:MAG: DUF494 family protein [Candidatus Latescibacteria bacterium]|nr:DUF494 family protein [Candidatus Latescibacterota bacterium]
MTNKTIEILIFLLGYLKENNFDVDSLGEFSESLVVSGYTENEVAEALGVLLEKRNLVSGDTAEYAIQKDTSVRIFNEFERIKIPPEVYGYLLKLRSMNIVNGIQMEKIIDYCLYMGSRMLTESDIDEILARILFEEHL